ncbi:MAG: C25 family cysteine peptidase [Anditalea sp.]
MKKIFTFFVFFLGSLEGMSQVEWIDYTRDYYKIPTAKDGAHQLGFTTLSASGVDMNRLDPRDIRVYHRGEEISIFVAGQNDGQFDAGDYIEFIGKRNDGTLDKDLYPEPEMMPNPYFNTHSDTTAYFLTVTPGIRGKRMSVKEVPEESIPILESYQAEYVDVYSDQYALGRTYGEGIRLAIYDRGQGWVGPVITRGNRNEHNFHNLGAISPSGSASLEIGLVGRSESPHLTAISVGPATGRLREIGQYSMDNFDFLKVEAPLSPTDFSTTGDLIVGVTSLGVDGAVDNISLSYTKINYTKLSDSGDFELETFSVPAGESKLEIPDVLENYVAYEISDFNHPVKATLSKNGNNLIIPAGQLDREAKMIVQQVNSVTEITLMEKVRFRNILQQPSDYIFISNDLLRKPSSSYADPVGAYAAYRATAAGGGFDTLTVNVDDLYNQFSFGEKSPLAIFEFLKQYYPRHQPEYLLLVGRSYGIYNTRRVGGVRYFYRNNPSVFDFQDLLPPAGYPYSDNRYAVGLDPAFPDRQDIAVGRIPARTPEEVGYYLEKIKEKDALGVQEDWQKNVVHLSGGRSAFELERFFNFLNGFKNIAEDIFLGGRVKTIRKRSNEVVELINISEEVNEGVSLVTFFGHSAPATTDIDIGFVSVQELGYDNKGKYPLLLLNGCDAGNSFGEAYTFGEDWIITPDKGASNYMAHSSVGVDVYLRRYSESFYTKAFSDSSLIYQSVGKVKIEAEKLFYSRYGASPINQSHTNQMIMLGDPAARIFPAKKADYAIQADDVFLTGFNDSPLNTLADSLNLSFVIRNIGRVDLDSIDLKVTRQLPDGTVIPYDPKKLAPIYRRDTLSFTIPNTGINSFGENFFTIEINKEKLVEELTYMNNTVTVSKFLQLSGTMNLAPLDFAIVDNQQIEIIAQIPGKSTEARNIVVQIDSVADFSSPGRRESRITTSNIARWPVELFPHFTHKDSVTFYWRSRFLEPKEGENNEWNHSSFSYIQEGPEGWTQRKLPQFDNNQLDNLEINRVEKEWKYEDTELNVDVFTFGSDNQDFSFNNTQIMLNGISYILDTPYRFCTNGSLGLMAFDQKTLVPYLPVPLTNIDVLDGKSCGRTPQVIQNIRNVWITGEGQTMLLDYVDGLKEGDYVVIFSVGEVTFSDWPDEAYAKLKDIGANEATLRNLKTGDPYILFGRKGMKPGEAIEVVADKNPEKPSDSQVITFQQDFHGYFTSGSIISPRIGPASDWVSFFGEVQERELFRTEWSTFDIIGVSPEGEEITLFENVQEDQVALQSINPDIYPYLRLKYAVDDPQSSAPEQLRKWQVNYTGVPEGVLIMQDEEENVQMKEGEEVEVKFEFSNISRYDYMDSLTVEWTFTNSDKRKVDKFSKKIPAVKAGESHEFSFYFNSLGWAGKTSLNIFANPREFQEQSFRNNLMDLPEYFVVLEDDQNPVLEVSFDGIYIMDGDIVSPNVLISALLKDENTLSLKKDTTGMEVSLKRDCEACEFERISFGSIKMKWFEATEESDFKLELQPGPLEDGHYLLRINGTDAAGNTAGEKPYEISFEVINESQITNFYPYPNPFSSSVRFVFTVTGAELPDQIKIQIMTVTGKVVREIFQDELGPIRIGNNISEYAWDGKDEFGDQLANGVYIYRVLVRKEGQFMEHRATAGDKAFKKGYGKMYLLR